MRRRPAQSGVVKVVPCMLAENNEPQINFDSISGASDSKRRFQLVFALALLVTALVLVVLKNRQFWVDALGLGETSEQTIASDTIKTSERPGKRASRKAVVKQNPSSNLEAPAEVLPSSQVSDPVPFQVDVTYSSGQHRTLVARNSSFHVELPNSRQAFAMPLGTVSNAAGPETGSAGAADKVRFASKSVELLGRPVEPIYPPLAQRENVQGSVVLQARIGEDGTVQGLQVISGPSILTTAALEAVKQWHFKPRVEAGKAVPAETRITVNFTISTQ